jgi:hypothetical protein
MTIVMLKDVYETNPALDSKVRRAAKKFGLRAEKSDDNNGADVLSGIILGTHES